MRAVADAGPIIHLSWIDQLHLLGLIFDVVVVPAGVLREIREAPAGVEGLERIQQFLTSRHVLAAAFPRLSDQIRSNLDMGESEALSLALEEPSILLTDDLAARAEAVRLGVRVSGTIGILIEARNRGVLVAVLPLLLELRRGQWLSDQLIEMVRATEPQA